MSLNQFNVSASCDKEHEAQKKGWLPMVLHYRPVRRHGIPSRLKDIAESKFTVPGWLQSQCEPTTANICETKGSTYRVNSVTSSENTENTISTN